MKGSQCRRNENEQCEEEKVEEGKTAYEGAKPGC